MKHVKTLSRTPAVAVLGFTSLEIKLNGYIAIIDRLLLAQRQSAWKVPFGEGSGDDDTTDTTTTTT